MQSSAERLKSILVIGKDAKTTDDLYKPLNAHFSSIKLLYPGKGKVTNPKYEAVAIVCSTEEEFAKIKDAAAAFKDAPVKAFIGKAFSAPGFDGLKSFDPADIDGLYTELNTQWGEVRKVVEDVFKSFDKDNSGSIDKSELKDAVSELGLTMTNDQVANMLRDLDLNKDGVIQLSEFLHWWLTGRKGATGNMKKLLAAKLNASKAWSSGKGAVKDMISQASGNDYEMKKSALKLSLNGGVEKAGFQIYAKAFPNGEEAKQLRSTMVARMPPLVGEDDEEQVYGPLISVTLKVKPGLIEAGFFDQYIQMINEQLAGQAKILHQYDGNTVTINVGISERMASTPIDEMEEFNKMLDCKDAHQTVMVEVKTGYSLDQLFDKSAGPMTQEVLQGGMSVRLEVELWKNFHSVLMRAIEQSPELMGIIGPILPAYIFQVTGNLDMTVDAEGLAQMLKIPAFEVQRLTAHTFVSAASPYGTVDDFEIMQDDSSFWSNCDGISEASSFDEGMKKFMEATKEGPFRKASYCLGHILGHYLDDSITFEVSVGPLAVSGFIEGAGLGKLVTVFLAMKGKTYQEEEYDY